MTAPVWQTSPGFLGTLTERLPSVVYLSATAADQYSLISGELPPGMNLNTSTGVISGTPLSVDKVITNKFVIRASNADGLFDRTFSIDIEGTSAPLWNTNPGLLPVGPNGELYTLNKEYVDYTLTAETDILNNGISLRYYIADNDGELPPGLTLTENGRIVGFINDRQISLDTFAGVSGGYDTEYYDGYPYDHNYTGTNNAVVVNVRPAYIPKIYEFTVTVTDSLASEKRKFSIQVDDPNNLRADTTFILSDTDFYSSNIGYLLPPLWQNKLGEHVTKVSNLGIVRASKQQIIPIYEYDPYPFVGPIQFDWTATVNPEIPLITDSQFNIAGFETKNLKGQTQVYFKDTKVFPVKGMKLRVSEYIKGADPITYTITGVVPHPTNQTSGYINLDKPLKDQIPNGRLIYVGSSSEHPPGLSLDTASGELYGRLQYQPKYTTDYRFTVKIIKTDLATNNTVETSHIFILTIKGDVTSSIEWVSPENIGNLISGEISELKIQAINTNTDLSLTYQLVSGQLPLGLTLDSDGTIQGQVGFHAQTYIIDTSTNQLMILDGGTTTVDKNWHFKVQASDVYRTSAVEKDFYISLIEKNFITYDRVYLKPFLSVDKRNSYREFVNTNTIFDNKKLYRPHDPNFGVQSSIKLIIEFALQDVDLSLYAGSMSEFFNRKRFYFGDVKSIVAKDNNRNDIYELVYVDIIDNQMTGNLSPSTPLSTVGNMQTALESIIVDSDYILTNDRLQPKFQTTIQDSTGVPLGFIKIVPICYALPGQSSKIISRIKNSGFDFKDYDFDTDRIIIENDVKTTWLAYPTTNSDLLLQH